MTEQRWENGPGETYPVHDHPYHKHLVVERGSITFHMMKPNRIVELHVGDTLDIPANTPHSATVGPSGVVCVETHRQ